MRNKVGGMRCDAGEHGACGINTAGRGRTMCAGDTKCMTETRVCAGNSEHMVGPQCVNRGSSELRGGGIWCGTLGGAAVV